MLSVSRKVERAAIGSSFSAPYSISTRSRMRMRRRMRHRRKAAQHVSGSRDKRWYDRITAEGLISDGSVAARCRPKSFTIGEAADVRSVIGVAKTRLGVDFTEMGKRGCE